MKIMLDPGHGGSDSGAVSSGYKEKDFTLSIGTKLRDWLQSNSDHKILMTRNRDVSLTLDERCYLANMNKVDLFVSLHVNAGGGTGYESYVYSGSLPPETLKVQEMIHSITMGQISSYSVRDRGKKRADFYVLHYTAMNAVLLENLFIDTDKDLDLLNNSKFIKDLVEGTGKGILSALGPPVDKSCSCSCESCQDCAGMR